MKKLLLIFAAGLFVFNANAQDKPTSDDGAVKFGIKAGVNFSDITGDDVDSFNGRTSFHFGVVVEVPISDNFSFQPELLYSAQGSDYEDTFDGETFSGSVKADFLNIPLMAKFYVGDGFSLEAGPQVGILMSAKEEFEGVEVDIKDSVKGIDFGVNFGLGYKMETGLSFGARYNLGLTDLNDDPDYLGDSSYKNSVIQISVGYFF